MSDGIDMEYTLDQPPVRAGEIYAQYDAKRAEFVRDSQALTLATLCDIVMGEDAKDTSDDALVRAVRTLMHERDEWRDLFRCANTAKRKFRPARFPSRRARVTT